jgi:hypothetical protein
MREGCERGEELVYMKDKGQTLVLRGKWVFFFFYFFFKKKKKKK